MDIGLTFHAHVDNLISTTARRLHQLRAVANSAFGPPQSDLRAMYTSYIRSMVEYGALSWHPALSRTRTRPHVWPLEFPAPRRSTPCRWKLLSRPSISDYSCTWLQGQRYQRLSPTDPLYHCAHDTPSAQRLHPLTGRADSDSILRQCGFDPSRRGTTHLPAYEKLPLHNREHLSFVAAFPPSQLPDLANVHFHCNIPGVIAKSPDAARRGATAAVLATHMGIAITSFGQMHLWTIIVVPQPRSYTPRPPRPTTPLPLLPNAAAAPHRRPSS